MKNVRRCFLAIITMTFQFPYLTIGQSISSIDLRLQSSTENQTVQIGTEGQITLTLENQSSINGTNIKVFINNAN